MPSSALAVKELGDVFERCGRRDAQDRVVRVLAVRCPCKNTARPALVCFVVLQKSPMTSVMLIDSFRGVSLGLICCCCGILYNFGGSTGPFVRFPVVGSSVINDMGAGEDNNGNSIL